MKTIIRNFLSVIRRYRLATVLNVLGLSVAFATCMVIMMQVEYDRNFDRCHRDADRIFRLDVSGFDLGWIAVNNHMIAEAFAASSPHILAVSFENLLVYGKLLFSVERDGVRHTYHELHSAVSQNFTDVFSFNMSEGVDGALREPGKVLIPQSLARKCFGTAPTVGQLLVARDTAYTVGGVYVDFPSNSTVRNDIYSAIPLKIPEEKDESFNLTTYVCTDGHADPDVLIGDFMKTFDVTSILGEDLAGAKFDFRLVPLPDIHYTTDARFDFMPKTSRQTVHILTLIAFIIILIAGINYANFSAALMPKRIRSINTQKVFGGSNGVIRLALVLEAVAVSVFSFLLALEWVSLAKDTSLGSLVAADIAPAGHPWIVAATALVAVLTGCAAGIWPAFRITSFAPALALKGSFGLSPRGRQLRNVLVGMQFFAAFALIIAASFIFLQNRYMLNSSPGYDRDAVIVIDINEQVGRQADAFSNRLKNRAGIESVALSQNLFGGTDHYSQWISKHHDKQIIYGAAVVSPSFLETMNIRLSEGRSFRPEDANVDNGVYIFNRSARDEFGLALNEKIRNAEIVGFMPDVKAASFRMAVEPMAFFVPPFHWQIPWQHVYIKVSAGANLHEAITHVRQTLAEFDADYPFDVRFFDEMLQKSYENELHFGLLITLFSLVAIFIAIVGVFGLVVFDSEYRRREIGLRKVFGATTREILVTFNKSYIRILVLCFALSAPIAWYAVARWLENFAYKTPMYWWVYVAAFAAIFLLTVCTVTFQNWRAANMNPVKSVKSE
ncbi:MAG: ABC transporter permease [Tannerella sp.]|jgi:putative ABC transport system permease protein|nr:ABC transporter permease [Tannerella sp.]